MPLTFPAPDPAPEHAERPRAGTLIAALRPSADHVAAHDLPPIFNSGDPGDPRRDVNVLTTATDRGPQPTEPPTLPRSAGSVEPDHSTE